MDGEENTIIISDLVDKVLNSSNYFETFILLPIEKQGVVFLELSQDIQNEISSQIKTKDILALFKFLDPDEVTDFLQNLPEELHLKVAKKLDEDLKEKVDYLLKFDPQSAAGLMSFDYIIVHKNSKVETLYAKLKKSINKGNKTPTVLVRDKENHLLGFIPFNYFILNKPETIEECIEDIPTIYFDEHYEDVIKKVKSSDHKNIVVVDYENHILGLIEIKNLFKVIEQSKTQNIYDFAGVKKEEDILDSAFSKFKSRNPWLIVNLGTAFIAASVVSLFEDTLTKLVLLAVYMPIIAGMGGNAATQTLAVVVRGISTHNLDMKTKMSVLFNEMGSGLLNGLVIGFFVAIIAWLINDMFMLGVVVGMAMIINLFVAGFFGSLLPFILKRFGIDPAVASSVFVTTATDVVGFFVFLGLAELLLFG